MDGKKWQGSGRQGEAAGGQTLHTEMIQSVPKRKQEKLVILPHKEAHR